jgi:hypothetical protein
MSGNLELDSLNSVKYLYLRELSEPKDNSLRIVVEEAVLGRDASSGSVQASLPELAEIMKDGRLIESTEGCRTFELSWTHYVAYLVTEECVGSCGKYDDESYTGKLFRVYTESHFLNHLARDTGGHVEPIQHYKLICLNHLVDVAAYAPPHVRLFETVSPHPPRIQ